MIYMFVFGPIIVLCLLGLSFFSIGLWFSFRASHNYFLGVFLGVVGALCLLFAYKLWLYTQISEIALSNEVIKNDKNIEVFVSDEFEFKKIDNASIDEGWKFTYYGNYERPPLFSTEITDYTQEFPPQEDTSPYEYHAAFLPRLKSFDPYHFLVLSKDIYHIYKGKKDDYPNIDVLEYPSMKILVGREIQKSFETNLSKEKAHLSSPTTYALPGSYWFLLWNGEEGKKSLKFFDAEKKTVREVSATSDTKIEGARHDVKIFKVDNSSFFLVLDQGSLDYSEKYDYSAGHSTRRFSTLFFVSPKYPSGLKIARSSIKEGKIDSVVILPNGEAVFKLIDNRNYRGKARVENYWKFKLSN